MNSKSIVQRKQRLDSLFEKVRAIGDDSEVKSHWARYLCVLVSGFIEQSVRIILTEYASNKSHVRVSNFVDRQLRDLQNAKCDKLLDWVARFDPTWRTTIEGQMDDRLVSAINSIVGNRHQIAHGHDVGLTYTQVKGYYDAVVEAIELIELECS